MLEAKVDLTPIISLNRLNQESAGPVDVEVDVQRSVYDEAFKGREDG
jgi:hypothetical protein